MCDQNWEIYDAFLEPYDVMYVSRIAKKSTQGRQTCRDLRAWSSPAKAT